MDDRWTIRRVADDARAMVEEVHGMTGVPYGRLISDAIRVWFELIGDDPANSGFGTLVRRRLKK